jgi:hypothetical protein
MTHPKARTNGLIVETIEDGLFIVDEERKTAHYVKQPAAFVWQHADGQHSVQNLADRLAAELHTPDAAEGVQTALQSLQAAHLLAAAEAPATPQPAPISRGQFLAVGAAALILSISLPTPAAAQSE